ncbi:MAG: GerMN domain-containing protein [Patescibacteria group bacterium]|nr:GerMN domain-containing protein [Patescibacteria group bacterium]
MKWRSISISILVVLAIGIAGYLFNSTESPKGNDSIPGTGIAIRLYYYNPANDQGPGGVQCSKNGLVAVERVIPETSTPLTETIKLLLRGEISQEEKIQGITSEFPLAGVSLISASIQDGVATLTFSDPQNKTSGGSCRVAILWAQIEATAKQFETVKSVRFVPEELFQP